MKTVLITGRMGAGKSEVLNRLKEGKQPVFSADPVAKKMLSPNSPCYPSLRSFFRESCLNEDGTFNKQALIQEIFNDVKKLKSLQNIVHPQVMNQWREFVAEKKKESHSLVFCEIPFFHTGVETNNFDFVVLVKAPDSLKLERLLFKGFSQKDVEQRWKNQISDSDFLSSAHFIIDNDKNLEDLRVKTDELLQNLKNKVGKSR